LIHRATASDEDDGSRDEGSECFKVKSVHAGENGDALRRLHRLRGRARSGQALSDVGIVRRSLGSSHCALKGFRSEETMKTTMLLAAAAMASMFAAGCQDDQALGTERSRELPEAPAPIEFPGLPPANAEGQATADTSTPRMPSETPNLEARRAWDNDPTGARAAGVPEVMNGEDLDAIPDLNEPIWSSGAGVDGMQRTPMETKGDSQVLGVPAPAR
jgi:hypothetical protein